jgi:hypothetical protein
MTALRHHFPGALEGESAMVMSEIVWGSNPRNLIAEIDQK